LETTLAADQRTVLTMGRAKEVRSLDVDYALASNGNQPLVVDDASLPVFLRVELSQFTRADGSDLDERKVWASARRVAADRVRVSLCVDRRDLSTREGSPGQPGELGLPGQYSGVISIIDPRLPRTDLPLVITLSYPHPWFVFAFVLLASLAGLVVAWLVHTKVADDSDINPRDLARWIATTTGTLSLAAGVFMAIQSFRFSYLTKETWGEDLFGDLMALVVASFSAFVGATASLKVVGLAARLPAEPRKPARDAETTKQ
jgi:hypothetical protein